MLSQSNLQSFKEKLKKVKPELDKALISFADSEKALADLNKFFFEADGLLLLESQKLEEMAPRLTSQNELFFKQRLLKEFWQHNLHQLQALKAPLQPNTLLLSLRSEPKKLLAEIDKTYLAINSLLDRAQHTKKILLEDFNKVCAIEAKSTEILNLLTGILLNYPHFWARFSVNQSFLSYFFNMYPEQEFLRSEHTLKKFQVPFIIKNLINDFVKNEKFSKLPAQHKLMHLAKIFLSNYDSVRYSSSNQPDEFYNILHEICQLSVIKDKFDLSQTDIDINAVLEMDIVRNRLLTFEKERMQPYEIALEAKERREDMLKHAEEKFVENFIEKKPEAPVVEPEANSQSYVGAINGFAYASLSTLASFFYSNQRYEVQSQKEDLDEFTPLTLRPGISDEPFGMTEEDDFDFTAWHEDEAPQKLITSVEEEEEELSEEEIEREDELLSLENKLNHIKNVYSNQPTQCFFTDRKPRVTRERNSQAEIPELKIAPGQ